MVDLRAGGRCLLDWLITLCLPVWMGTLSSREADHLPMKPMSMNPPLLSLYAMMCASSNRGLKVPLSSD